MLIEVLNPHYKEDSNLLLSRLIDELHKLGAPIVFKGSMIIQYMTKNNPNRVLRKTKDADASWNIEELQVTMSELTEYVTKAVYNISHDLKVRVNRDFGNSPMDTAWFSILYKDEVVAALDVTINPDYFDSIYITYEGIKIHGSHVCKVVVDKLSTVSTQRIFPRFKDLVDLYIIAYSSNESFTTEDIFLTASLVNKKIDNFYYFLHEKDNLHKLYDKFKRVVNKPDFNEFYDKILYFLDPFIKNKAYPELLWHNHKWQSC